MRDRLYCLFLAPLLACGNSPTARVSVELAEDMPTGVMESLGDRATYRGIFFEFRELRGWCEEKGIFDYDSTVPPALVYPSGENQPGVAPEDSYTINTSTLKTNAYYQLKMVARRWDNNSIAYEGLAGCPIHLGLEQTVQNVICFGYPNSVPVCFNVQWPPAPAGCNLPSVCD